MERMQNLGKCFGFHEDAQSFKNLGCWELGMLMGFWVFPSFFMFVHQGRLGCFLLIASISICFHKC